MADRRERRPAQDGEERFGGTIEGRNAVLEALRAGRGLEKVYLAEGDTDHTLHRIAALAREKGAVVTACDRRKLDAMSETHAHQGVIAVASAVEYATVEDLLALARERGQTPLLVVCDGITDPHNLGAVLRTAEAAGAQGVIIPKRRAVGVNAVVGKTSAGALEHIKVCKVANLTDTLKLLKKQGLWVYGTAADGGTSLYDAGLDGPAVIVIGSEGDGMSRLVREACDFVVSIPMMGKMNSLNASAAAAVLLYEAVRKRQSRTV